MLMCPQRRDPALDIGWALSGILCQADNAPVLSSVQRFEAEKRCAKCTLRLWGLGSERQDCCVAQVLAAEEAGAIAAIIVNSEHTMMPMGEDERYNPTIPSIHIPLAAGQALRSALAASSGGLWGTLRALPGQQDSSGPKAASATPASAATPAGRPAAGSEALTEVQVARRSSEQREEGAESVGEHEAPQRTQAMSIDDYYSPEEDMEEGVEPEGPAGEGSCLLGSSALSAGASDWGAARPLPEFQEEIQGTTMKVSVTSPCMTMSKHTFVVYDMSSEGLLVAVERSQ